MGKLLLLTLNEQEETAIDKIISAISDYIQIEPMQITTACLDYPYGKLQQHQTQRKEVFTWRMYPYPKTYPKSRQK